MTTPLNLLVAFPYMKPEVVEQIRKLRHARILVDSGAFTAWKAGKSVDLDEYCRFIEALGDLPWRYFMLDVVGDPAATMKNYEIMLNRGFNPIPIFTRGEDPSVLEDYYKTSDVVGVGGLVGTRGNRGFVKGIMEKEVSERCIGWALPAVLSSNTISLTCAIHRHGCLLCATDLSPSSGRDYQKSE